MSRSNDERDAVDWTVSADPPARLVAPLLDLDLAVNRVASIALVWTLLAYCVGLWAVTLHLLIGWPW